MEELLLRLVEPSLLGKAVMLVEVDQAVVGLILARELFALHDGDLQLQRLQLLIDPVHHRLQSLLVVRLFVSALQSALERLALVQVDAITHEVHEVGLGVDALLEQQLSDVPVYVRHRSHRSRAAARAKRLALSPTRGLRADTSSPLSCSLSAFLV